MYHKEELLCYNENGVTSQTHTYEEDYMHPFDYLDNNEVEKNSRNLRKIYCKYRFGV